jgi:D-alanine-D-alanine ligase
VAGGDSGEFEVSVNSAAVVNQNLDLDEYNPYIVQIQSSDWFYEDGNGKTQIDKNDFSLTLGNQKIVFDCVFIAIHGTPGEDGKLQGYFEMIGMPYTTCNWIVSALTFDKHLTKIVCNQLGIIQARALYFKKHEANIAARIMDEIGLPCFVKPNKSGSSVGISLVKKEEELSHAIELAFNEDVELLAEEPIVGRELACGVLRFKNQMIVMPVTEIISKKDFFDYEAKYEGMADEITPANIPLEVENDCKALSASLYNSLNCAGICRFDFIFNENGMYFLEVNSVPGFSAASIVPQEAESMGMSKKELFGMAIEDAFFRAVKK